jgi:hypothetical protein
MSLARPFFRFIRLGDSKAGRSTDCCRWGRLYSVLRILPIWLESWHLTASNACIEVHPDMEKKHRHIMADRHSVACRCQVVKILVALT